MPLEIVNSALRYAGEPLIGALSDNTEGARNASIEYKKALRWLVGFTEWNCQIVIDCPRQIEGVDCHHLPQGYSYVFEYPEAAERIASVCLFRQTKNECDCVPDWPPVKYRTLMVPVDKDRKKVIVADCCPIQVEYTILPDDCEVQSWPQYMRDALTFRIAQFYFLKNRDAQNEQNMALKAERAARMASDVNNSQQSRQQQLDCGPFVRGRQW